MADTTHPSHTHHTPPFQHLRRTEAPLSTGEWGLVVLGTAKSVGPDETVQQSTRLGVRLLILDGDDGDLEDGMGQVGVHGKVGDAGPNVFVAHRVLVGVVPPSGDVQWLNEVNTAVDGNL